MGQGGPKRRHSNTRNPDPPDVSDACAVCGGSRFRFSARDIWLGMQIAPACSARRRHRGINAWRSSPLRLAMFRIARHLPRKRERDTGGVTLARANFLAAKECIPPPLTGEVLSPTIVGRSGGGVISQNMRAHMDAPQIPLRLATFHVARHRKGQNTRGRTALGASSRSVNLTPPRLRPRPGFPC